MAKQHIRFFARQLASYYKQAEEILSDAGLATQDVMFSPEEQREFSKYKAAVDGELSLLSVALSSAAQGKLSNIIKSVKGQIDSFTAPMQEAVENLTDNSMPEDQVLATKRLIAVYTEQLKKVEATLETLKAVEEWANFPASKKKQAYLSRNLRPLPLVERLGMCYETSRVFDALRAALDEFRFYVASLSSAAQSSEPIDDLSE